MASVDTSPVVSKRLTCSEFIMYEDGNKVLGEFEALFPSDPRSEGKTLRAALLQMQKHAAKVEMVVRYGTAFLTVLQQW